MIKLSGEIAGRFKIEKFKTDADGVELEGTRQLVADWFPNLITDNGMNLFGSSTLWLNFCQVGSGSTPPSFADTNLVSRIAGTSNKETSLNGAQPSAPYFTWRRNTYRFAEGVATGNISEIGIGTVTNGDLFSRALVLDSFGNPTTIPVAADESLDVTYEFRYYPSTVDAITVLVLDGNDYEVTARAAIVNNATSGTGWFIGSSGNAATLQGSGSASASYSGAIGAITANPSGSTSGSTGVTNAAYSNDSHSRDGTVTWALAAGNFPGGIGAVSVKHGIGRYQFGFNPTIPKTAEQVLTLDFRHSWSRRS